MFYESLIILNISTLNFSEGVPASVLAVLHSGPLEDLKILGGFIEKNSLSFPKRSNIVFAAKFSQILSTRTSYFGDPEVWLRS